MQKLKIALALTILVNGAVFAEECEMAAEVIEETQELEAFNEEQPSELKELISAMKQDSSVNKERVKRLKKLIRERGWSKHDKGNQPAAEAVEESV